MKVLTFSFGRSSSICSIIRTLICRIYFLGRRLLAAFPRPRVHDGFSSVSSCFCDPRADSTSLPFSSWPIRSQPKGSVPRCCRFCGWISTSEIYRKGLSMNNVCTEVWCPGFDPLVRVSQPGGKSGANDAASPAPRIRAAYRPRLTGRTKICRQQWEFALFYKMIGHRFAQILTDLRL